MVEVIVATRTHSADADTGSGWRSWVIPAVGALGIVYGDIGTSPLYAYRVAVEAAVGHAKPTSLEILGVLSLIIWSLILIISVKYILFVMRADNHGEGGILALLALVRPWSGSAPRRRGWLITIGIFGAALLYGDGVITPAISVISAIEGIEIVTPLLKPYVTPLTVVILIALFSVQYLGTASIGRLFGPVMVAWFLAIGLLGLAAVVQTPQVLWAFDPEYGVMLLAHEGRTAFAVVGAVILAVTGGEALYADMGHVGRSPIRVAWTGFVLPALLLNYTGQAALLLRNPAALENPFYKLAPDWMVLPLVILATAATVIASQALISGVFSLTRQASQLGLWPRVRAVQTSSAGYGQIYVPLMNWGMMVLTVAVALIFHSSEDLAAAYGIAVSGTMLITAILLYEAMRVRWRWPALVRIPLGVLFIGIDFGFFAANMVKLPEGGWLPLAGGVAMFLLMAVWTKGVAIVDRRLIALTEKWPEFLARIESGDIHRMPGTGVFVTRASATVPPALLHHLHHNMVLQERVIILAVSTAEVPRIPARHRLTLEPLAQGIWLLKARYGFMQTPNVPLALRGASLLGLEVDPEAVTYYVGHERIVPNPENTAMQGPEEVVFAFMARNAAPPTDYFKIRDDQVMEVGIRIDV